MITTKKETIYTKDVVNKKIRVVREFDAPVENVWKAWTESELLDKWWAPKPWKTVTKSMDFREGGSWLYLMQGPEGENSQLCRVDYEKINAPKNFSGFDMFCDENGNKSEDFPDMHWDVSFNKTPTGTRVDVEITFKSEADMEKIIEMGFKEGFAAAHNNLDEVLAK